VSSQFHALATFPLGKVIELVANWTPALCQDRHTVYGKTTLVIKPLAGHFTDLTWFMIALVVTPGHELLNYINRIHSVLVRINEKLLERKVGTPV
jgi:hypothetical protein